MMAMPQLVRVCTLLLLCSIRLSGALLDNDTLNDTEVDLGDLMSTEDFFNVTAALSEQVCEEFTCSGESQCVDVERVCDCVEDCRDGSDEAESMCSKLRFKCEDKCHPMADLCDGTLQCEDGSDEKVDFCWKDFKTWQCLGDPDAGPCEKQTERFFWNATAGECQRFWYGGCAGNINNHETLESCEGTCHEVGEHLKEMLDHPCLLPPMAGPCEAAVTSYFFNVSAMQCQTFTYGGCEGNANRFSTVDECYEACSKKDHHEEENNCENGYTCKDGSCPKELGRCDGKVQCEDGSDEEDCGPPVRCYVCMSVHEPDEEAMMKAFGGMMAQAFAGGDDAEMKEGDGDMMEGMGGLFGGLFGGDGDEDGFSDDFEYKDMENYYEMEGVPESFDQYNLEDFNMGSSDYYGDYDGDYGGKNDYDYEYPDDMSYPGGFDFGENSEYDYDYEEGEEMRKRRRKKRWWDDDDDDKDAKDDDDDDEEEENKPDPNCEKGEVSRLIALPCFGQCITGRYTMTPFPGLSYKIMFRMCKDMMFPENKFENRCYNHNETLPIVTSIQSKEEQADQDMDGAFNFGTVFEDMQLRVCNTDLCNDEPMEENTPCPSLAPSDLASNDSSVETTTTTEEDVGKIKSGGTTAKVKSGAACPTMNLLSTLFVLAVSLMLSV